MSSKASDGPTASSFVNPRKTGWLYKHGGSGMSSHWRKRWFIVDHHYLFYYKGPNDKKPVGILCLPDYETCRKADNKEWKKPHTFILDKGNAVPEHDSTEAPIKNYVLYSDTEEDMREWINAILEEIKPVLGEKGLANGHPPTRPGRRKDEAKVDQKAFDELTKSAHEGPKLTHLTAQRPRMKGRRPPQRYATYHEDDTKEESPPGTPPEHRKTLPEIPSPSNSPPSTARKGHHPTVPLRPKPRAESTMKQLEDQEAVEAVAKTEGRVSPGTKKLPRPPPPKKPQKEPSEVALMVAPTPPHEDSKSPEPNEPTPSPRPSTTRPIPPKKPPKDESQPTPMKEAEQKLVTGIEPNSAPQGGSKPVPPRKPRPQLPTKSRTSTTALEMPSPTLSPMEPTKRPVPVPRKRTRTATDTKVEAPREQVANEAEVEKEGLKPKVEEHLPAVEEETESVVTKGEEESKPVLPAPSESDRTEESQSEGKEETETPIYENVDVEGKEEEIDKLAGEMPEKEPIEESPKAKDTKEEVEVAKTPPPDRTSNMNRPIVSEELSETGGVVDSEENTKGSEPQQEAKPGEGAFIDSAGYEKMDPIEPIRISPEYGDYEPMNEGVLIQLRALKESESKAAVGTSHEYDEPIEWRPSSGESEAPPLPPQYNEFATGVPSKVVYDVPPPPKPSNDTNDTYDVPKSATNSTSASPVPSAEGGEEGQRSGVQSSSGSTSSARSDHKRQSQVTTEGTTIDLAVAAVIGKEGEWQAGRETVNKSPTSNSTQQKPKWKPDRDALGYTRVTKPRTNDDKSLEGPTSLSSNDMDVDENSDWHLVGMEGEQVSQTSLDLIPSTLKQAREILRLARVVKAEAEQIKQEAQRELDLARTERRDAELLKRNASGILKMAKEKLQSASK